MLLKMMASDDDDDVAYRACIMPIVLHAVHGSVIRSHEYMQI